MQFLRPDLLDAPPYVQSEQNHNLLAEYRISAHKLAHVVLILVLHNYVTFRRNCRSSVDEFQDTYFIY